jgi:hypothetical protein
LSMGKGWGGALWLNLTCRLVLHPGAGGLEETILARVVCCEALWSPFKGPWTIWQSEGPHGWREERPWPGGKQQLFTGRSQIFPRGPRLQDTISPLTRQGPQESSVLPCIYELLLSTWNVSRWLCVQSPLISCPVVTILQFLITSGHRAPCFHFAPDPKHQVASPVLNTVLGGGHSSEWR